MCTRRARGVLDSCDKESEARTLPRGIDLKDSQGRMVEAAMSMAALVCLWAVWLGVLVLKPLPSLFS